MNKLVVITLTLTAVFVLAACTTASELPEGPVTPIVPPPGVLATSPARATSAPIQPASTVPPAPIPTAGVPVPVTLPSQPPVAQRGQAVYETRCAPCHGASGKGDGPQGPTIVASMGGKLPNFADAAYARSIKPVDWFNVISNGRLQKGMPPFNSLAPEERWDVAAYLYTFAISQDQLDQGKAVYTTKCASCHGATGTPSTPGTSDLADAAKMASRSQADFDAIIANGKGAMPGFGTLSQAERQASADYVRSLSVSFAKIAAPTGQASIIGALVNGTSGAQTPGNLPVTLYAISPDGSSLMYTRTTTTDAGGHFSFDKLDGSTPIMYGLQVAYLKAAYTSDPLTFAHGGLTLTVPITVYETSGDASGVRVEQMHAFFDYSGPGSVTIGQVFIVSNLSDRTYLATDGTSLKFPLPQGAMNVQFIDGELGGRYRAAEGGFADTEAVVPGTSTTQLFVSYDLAYDGKKLDLNWKMPYAVTNINVLIPEGNAKLTSAQLTQSGVRQTQSGNMVNFVGGNISAGQSLVLQLTGALTPPSSDTTAPLEQTSSPILIIAAALLLLAVAIVAFVWLRQRQQAALAEEETVDVEASQDELLDAIAALDDDFEAGQIQEADYRRQRAELKAELVELMKAK